MKQKHTFYRRRSTFFWANVSLSDNNSFFLELLPIQQQHIQNAQEQHNNTRNNTQQHATPQQEQTRTRKTGSTGLCHPFGEIFCCPVVACRCMALLKEEQRGDAASALRTHWRHEQLTLQMAPAAALHHSRDVEPESYNAPRSQRTARAGREEENEMHFAMGQTTPPFRAAVAEFFPLDAWCGSGWRACSREAADTSR